MALSKKDKTKILFYFGWSGLTIVPASTHFNSVVDDRLEDASNDTEICAMVKSILKKIESIDACLEKAKCRLAASKVDNITTNPEEIRMLRSERKRCIRELGDLLDIPIIRSGGNVIGVCN